MSKGEREGILAGLIHPRDKPVGVCHPTTSNQQQECRGKKTPRAGARGVWIPGWGNGD
jgi:hypothetical protein